MIGYFSLGEYKQNERLKISDQYNKTVAEYSETNKENTELSCIHPVKEVMQIS